MCVTWDIVSGTKVITLIVTTMRRIYLFAILMGLAAWVQAQSFSVRPSTTKDTTVAIDHSVDVYIYFDNEFQQPLTLAWEETAHNFPQDWLMTICDNFACYNIPHGLDTMASVSQGGYGFLKVTCTPLVVGGFGTVSYHVYDANNPLYTTNVTFNFNAVTSAVSNALLSERFTVSPVPAHDALHLTARNGLLDKGTLRLYDLKGQQMRSQSVSAVQSASMDVQALSPGMYMLRYETNAGTLTQKVVVTH